MMRIHLLTVILCCPISKQITLWGSSLYNNVNGSELIKLSQPLKHVKSLVIEPEKKVNLSIDVYKLKVKSSKLDFSRNTMFGILKWMAGDINILVCIYTNSEWSGIPVLQYKVSVGGPMSGIDIRQKICATSTVPSDGNLKLSTEEYLLKLHYVNKIEPFSALLVSEQHIMVLFPIFSESSVYPSIRIMMISNESSMEWFTYCHEGRLMIYNAPNIKEDKCLVTHSVDYNIDQGGVKDTMCHIVKISLLFYSRIVRISLRLLLLIVLLVKYSAEWLSGSNSGVGQIIQHRKVTVWFIYSIIHFLFQILESILNRQPNADQAVANYVECGSQSRDERRHIGTSDAIDIASCELETVESNSRITDVEDENTESDDRPATIPSISSSTTVQMSKHTRIKYIVIDIASCELKTVESNSRITDVEDENTESDDGPAIPSISSSTTVQMSKHTRIKYIAIDIASCELETVESNSRITDVKNENTESDDGPAIPSISSSTTVQMNDGEVCKPLAVPDLTVKISTDASRRLETRSVDDTKNDVLEKKINVNLFLDMVASKIPLKWKDFGKMLELNSSFLDCLQEENLTCERRFISIIREWKKTECLPYTWRTALRIVQTRGFIQKQNDLFANDIANDIVKHVCSTQLNDDESINYWIEQHSKNLPLIVLDMEIDVPLFLDLVASNIQSKWEEFGAMLGLNLSFLECLLEEKSCSKKRFISLLREWRKTECSPFTWRTVLEILVGNFIHASIVADDLVEQLELITCSPKHHTECMHGRKKQQGLFLSSHTLDMKIDEGLFLKMVAPKIQSNWEEFGAMVKLNLSFLESLLEEKHVSKRFDSIIYEWKKTECLPFNWRTVIKILNGNFLCQHKLANDLVTVLITNQISNAEFVTPENTESTMAGSLN